MSIKKIPPAQFLLDTGLLFEINRRVLHPLGYALSVDVNGNKYSIGDLWVTDDPTGFEFGEDSLAEGRAKVQAYMQREGAMKISNRMKTTGFIVQPKKHQITRKGV